MARLSAIAVREESETPRYFQRGTALNRVLLEAPFLPRCSDDKTAAMVRPRSLAIRYPYMQVNRGGRVSWLIFDLDHRNAFIWDDVNLPAPNLVVSNRQTGHSHLFYAIGSVCTTEKARSKPIEYMRAIYEAMAARLQADPQFHSGPVAKTPGHPWWLTTELHNHEYQLGDLAEYVDLATAAPWGKGPDLENAAHSRHCLLFEQLRYYAYSIVNREREKGSFESFNRLLDAYAYNRNSFAKHGFSEDLPLSSIRATVKSVARWTWDRYRGTGRCHRGVMQLDKALPLVERQRLSAQRTTALQTQASESKIRAACRRLHEQGKALLQTSIAKLTGLTRQTVATYKHLFQEMAKPASITSAESVRTKTKTVKSGAHQVPAPPAGMSFLNDVLHLTSVKVPDGPS